MLPYHQPIDPENPLGASAARDGIPALRTEAARISSAIAACSAHLRIYQMKVDAVFGALAPEIALLPAEAFGSVSLEVTLMAGEFETAEALINKLQEGNADITVDDCLNEIFITGLEVMAHRLIPS